MKCYRKQKLMRVFVRLRFHLLIISTYVYQKSESTGKEAATLRLHVATVAQNVDLGVC